MLEYPVFSTEVQHTIKDKTHSQAYVLISQNDLKLKLGAK